MVRTSRSRIQLPAVALSRIEYNVFCCIINVRSQFELMPIGFIDAVSCSIIKWNCVSQGIATTYVR